MNKIRSLLSVGDVVYSACSGKPMTVISIEEHGFATAEDFFNSSDANILSNAKAEANIASASVCRRILI